MEKLAASFRQKGFRFTQIERTGNFAIYLKENDVPFDSNEYHFSYEVIKIQVQRSRAFLSAGKEVNYPAREVYPGDKSWGVLGWTFRDGTKAREYFKKCIVGAPSFEKPYVIPTPREEMACSSHHTANIEDLASALTP